MYGENNTVIMGVSPDRRVDALNISPYLLSAQAVFLPCDKV